MCLTFSLHQYYLNNCFLHRTPTETSWTSRLGNALWASYAGSTTLDELYRESSQNLCMRATFRCQSGWAKGCPKSWQTLCLAVSVEGVSGRDQHMSQQTEWRRSSSPLQVGIMQFTEGLDRAKRWGKGKFLLSWGWDSSSLLLPSDIGASHSPAVHHQPSGSPACKWQIMGLLGLRKSMRQVL